MIQFLLQCDVTCGGGVRTRPVTCVTLQNDNPVDEALCSDPKPHETEPCGAGECPCKSALIETKN